MKWINIENIKIDESVNSIHIYTRDFHAIVSPEKRKMSKKEQHYETNDLYLIKDKDVRGWLKYLEDITGGNHRWRNMRFTNLKGGVWITYLRLYRVGEHFLVCGQHNLPLEWRLMKEENLQKEYLCCHD